MRLQAALLNLLAPILSLAAVAWSGISTDRPVEGIEPGAIAPRTHQVTVNGDGTFTPGFLYINDGDTVQWLLAEPTDSIIPVEPPQSSAANCRARRAFDSTDPNEFTGPMPHWPSGIFTLGPDARGNVIVSNPANCPTQLVAAAAGQYLCRAGARAATMDWTWQNPNLTGVFVRMQWKDIHLGPNAFDWTLLDRELDKAVQNGKLYSLSFKAGSDGTPEWIFDDPVDPVTRLTFQDAGDESDSATPLGCGVRMDLGSPADPNYRKHYFALLTAAAEHVKSRNDWYRALAYVKLSGANLFTHENRLPKRCECGCPICNSEVWATQGDYTPQALYEYYQLQGDLLRDLYPEKSLSYALIQDGFPRVNSATEYETCEAGPPASPAGVEQTERILQGGRVFYGLDFVVQHNGLQTRPQDRDPPQPPCANEGTHPHTSPFSTTPGCPNRWVLREGERGQVTGFQTTNAVKVANPIELESALRNGIGNTDAIFLEVYEERFWEAEVGGPLLDPNGTGRTLADWADAFHAQRRSLWPDLPDPFPLVHSHTFTRTAAVGEEAQLFHYIHGSKCGRSGAESLGVIAVLPHGVALPTITPTPVATSTVTSSRTPTTASCTGDCNGDREVTVDELVRGVNMALGSAPVSGCPSFDTRRDRRVTVDELVAAVNAALRGC